VQEADTGIEPQRGGGQSRLGFEQCLQVVQNRIRGIDRQARRAGQQRPSGQRGATRGSHPIVDISYNAHGARR
jgi:hypothetical protein